MLVELVDSTQMVERRLIEGVGDFRCTSDDRPIIFRMIFPEEQRKLKAMSHWLGTDLAYGRTNRLPQL